MSRRLFHIGPVIMAAWILIFSVVAPLELVLCVGDNGHMALEKEHDRGHVRPLPEIPTGISHNDCGDCSDTPIFLFYGRVRTSSRLHTPGNQFLGLVNGLSILSGIEQNWMPEKVTVPDNFLFDHPVNLSSVILIC